MCTYVSIKDGWHDAAHPIVCYKVMMEKKLGNSVRFKSYFYGNKNNVLGHTVKAKKKTLCIPYLYPYADIGVINGEGVHAFMAYKDACEERKFIENDLAPEYEKYLKIIECIILPGIKYIKGKDNNPLSCKIVNGLNISSRKKNDVICAKSLIINRIVNEKNRRKEEHVHQ